MMSIICILHRKGVATIQSILALFNIIFLSILPISFDGDSVLAQELVPSEQSITKSSQSFEIDGNNLHYKFSNPRRSENFFLLDLEVDNETENSFQILNQLNFDLIIHGEINGENTEIHPVVFMSDPHFEGREFLQAETLIDADSKMDLLTIAFNIDDLKKCSELIIETDPRFVKEDQAKIYLIQLKN